ncbi:MAG TPA: preprotein translocase subunit SecA [Deltaproteobacteria bacterium]|nr:MAG: preprotein translocase subunit SecA [Deltaproteobacteria bacterium GWA2_55_82]OGQ62390.1 MAG: preprotein translocase subunit SecA [Deltaproteobacteria bacterium RIFCSPLOWO2_02_FULL_55_12]OIJ73302.1 MAG: preprotein translocase subunit SecA [Deltaproteobacteria bacterium GWC2_55_46]HBG45429.1 preprotein translocase subunit SecA [Deltaproteobacteria bacterium]HCY10260.1 preprotein translocase subunit SecA [Deltaproteobacteria bacterium]
MINSLLKKVFGSKNDREVKRIMPVVEEINSFEPQMKALSDEDFLGLTLKLKEELAGGKTLDDILPRAFAAAREVAWRRLKMRHFDVQLIGGYVLNAGTISEMKTGEGKTLVATLPLYLNALTGKGAHLVTVNDYLARRDGHWMGAVYHALGLTLSVIQHEASFLYDPSYTEGSGSFIHFRPISRKEAYNADITYGTNNEYGFDYLRDNMKFSLEEYVQREHHFAIVDEVDSILIDEARTPLIISGPTEDSTDKYYTIDRIMPGLRKDDHFTVDEKAKQVLLTDEGVDKVEELLKIDNLYDPANIETLHHVNQALRAHALFHRDVEYVVKDGQVIIVDEFTGRLMPGRRWSDGLHQAVEAKEKVKIENENQTLATVTFQNYFRMYEKLAGMTGTADTEAAEFRNIYSLDVMVIPTNKPLARADNTDLVYKTKKEKFKAVIKDIEECHRLGRPVLVGTISIDDSERLSKMLSTHNVPHHVLNAKQHEREAEIVAQAGRLRAVTISTNMAGRGTDILLGGNPEYLAAARAGKDDSSEPYHTALEKARVLCEEEKQKVLALGGLYILGTERHESRRIDNQLRGRAGRQGDPGISRFYLSLEDDLLRIFGSDRIASVMERIGMEEDVPIEHGLVSRAIENAQKKVEGHNFEIRKHLLEYDDVMNQQRSVVYGYRKQILSQAGLRDMVKEFSEEASREIVSTHISERSHPEDWDLKAVNDAAMTQFGVSFGTEDMQGVNSREALAEALAEKAWKSYQEKVGLVGDEPFLQFEKVIMLHTLDTIWKDHLLSMDHLKGGIGLRGYGQKNPLQEYKKEGFELFAALIGRLRSEVCERLFKVQIKRNDEEAPAESVPEPARRPPQKVRYSRGEEDEPEKEQPVTRAGEKIGRNDLCPCGSGLKYKRCCGMKAVR